MGSFDKPELHASDEDLIAYDFVSVKSIPEYRTGFQLGKFRIIRILHRLRADRLSPVLGHDGLVCPRGATRLAPGF